MATWPRLHTRNSFLSVFLLILVSPASGLMCYQCGQYTDGAGSITPCMNLTEDHLKHCPQELSNSCIKYINGGSVVRACAHECVEIKLDSWGTSTYCCNEDACNAASSARLQILTGSLLLSVVFFNRLGLSAFAFPQALFLLFCLFY